MIVIQGCNTEYVFKFRIALQNPYCTPAGSTFYELRQFSEFSASNDPFSKYNIKINVGYLNALVKTYFLI